MSDFSERDGQLLALFGMTEEQVREAEMIAESETIPDGLVGPVYSCLADGVQCLVGQPDIGGL